MISPRMAGSLKILQSAEVLNGGKHSSFRFGGGERYGQGYIGFDRTKREMLIMEPDSVSAIPDIPYDIDNTCKE